MRRHEKALFKFFNYFPLSLLLLSQRFDSYAPHPFIPTSIRCTSIRATFREFVLRDNSLALVTEFGGLVIVGPVPGLGSINSGNSASNSLVVLNKKKTRYSSMWRAERE